MKTLLHKAIASGNFTIESARELAATDWRSWVSELSGDVKTNAQVLFHFIEGYVEETDEGFVDEPNDPELYERTIALLDQLQPPPA